MTSSTLCTSDGNHLRRSPLQFDSNICTRSIPRLLDVFCIWIRYRPLHRRTSQSVLVTIDSRPILKGPSLLQSMSKSPAPSHIESIEIQFLTFVTTLSQSIFVHTMCPASPLTLVRIAHWHISWHELIHIALTAIFSPINNQATGFCSPAHTYQSPSRKTGFGRLVHNFIKAINV